MSERPRYPNRSNNPGEREAQNFLRRKQKAVRAFRDAVTGKTKDCIPASEDGYRAQRLRTAHARITYSDRLGVVDGETVVITLPGSSLNYRFFAVAGQRILKRTVDKASLGPDGGNFHHVELSPIGIHDLVRYCQNPEENHHLLRFIIESPAEQMRSEAQAQQISPGATPLPA